MSQIGVKPLTRRAIATLFMFVPLAGMPVPAMGTAAGAERSFSSPEVAGEALVAALKADDRGALPQILGSETVSLLTSGDSVADQREYERFVTAYDLAHHWIRMDDESAVLEIGEKGWPFPIPLRKDEAGWRFDGERGAEEIVNRRVGGNELDAIQACLAFVDAEREYYRRNPRDRATPEYARFILSSEGKKDGLYWKTAADESPSPLGWAYAAARSQGYAHAQGKSAPFHGYLYHVLRGQGPHAPGGAYDYVEGDAMTRGFALVAWPAKYDGSGVMTFVVNQLGLVYQKDLGPDTAKLASELVVFDPDETWTLTDAQDRALPDTASAR